MDRLLARIYEVFPLRCPECGSDMRILAFLTDPGPVGAILRHLELPHPGPTLPRPGSAPGSLRPRPGTDRADGCRGAPLLADDFDQTPAFDPAEPEPVRELDLDQTCGA